jgi:hypothetical protein
LQGAARQAPEKPLALQGAPRQAPEKPHFGRALYQGTTSKPALSLSKGAVNLQNDRWALAPEKRFSGISVVVRFEMGFRPGPAILFLNGQFWPMREFPSGIWWKY